MNKAPELGANGGGQVSLSLLRRRGSFRKIDLCGYRGRDLFEVRAPDAGEDMGSDSLDAAEGSEGDGLSMSAKGAASGRILALSGLVAHMLPVK